MHRKILTSSPVFCVAKYRGGVQRTEGLIQAKVSKTKNILDLHSGLNPTPQKLPSLRARPVVPDAAPYP